MSRTSKSSASIPHTVSTPPPDEALPALASGSLKSQGLSSTPVSLASDALADQAFPSQPLPEEQNPSDNVLFQRFLAFMRSCDSLPPLSQAGVSSSPAPAASVSDPAPSVPPCSVPNPPMTESRSTSTPSLPVHTLFGLERGSRPVNSAPPLRSVTTSRVGCNEGRSEASRPRGAFGGADATPTSVNPFVGYDTNLDYGYLGRSHGFPFGPVLFVPRRRCLGRVLPQVFPVWFFPPEDVVSQSSLCPCFSWTLRRRV